MLSGKPSIGMAIFMQSGGNALEVAQAIRDKMDEMKKSFPPGVDFATPFDPTRFVSASIEEVTVTILEAGALVILVVFVFLQTWRATLIPVHRRAGVADRHVRRPVAGRLLDQHADAVRHGACRSASSWTMRSSCWRTSSA